MKTLQTGKSYKARNGDLFFISKNASLEYPFLGSNEEGDEWQYASNGLFIIGNEHELDLIIPEEDQEVLPVAKPEIPHLEVILAIAQNIPVQYDYMLSGTWHDFEVGFEINPVNFPKCNWRIKPKSEQTRTVVIGKRTVVAPEVEVPLRVKSYFYWDSSQGCVLDSYWCGTVEDRARLSTGNLFYSENDAENCYEAISALLLGTDSSVTTLG